MRHKPMTAQSLFSVSLAPALYIEFAHTCYGRTQTLREANSEK